MLQTGQMSHDTSADRAIKDGEADFRVEPLTHNCRDVYRNAHHLLIGVSPGNSYFSVSLLTGLFRWACVRFRQVDVVVPDAALPDNFLAAGYPWHRAAHKANTELRTLRSRISRAWSASGIPARRQRTHLLSDLTEHPDYRRLHAATKAALHADSQLGRTASEMIRAVLRKQLDGAEPTPEQIRHGQRYLSAELPFMLGSATIFQVSSSLNFYHRKIPLAESLYQTESSLQAPPNQGYAIIRPHFGRPQ